MANDITGINSSKTQHSGDRLAQRVKDGDKSSSSGTTNSSPGGSDKVSLTHTAARLKDIEQRLATQTPMDQQRVNDVKTAINKGEYSVNPDRVADKMIEMDDSLFS